MKAADIKLNLISNYQMKRRIWNRFHDPANEDLLRVNCAKTSKTRVVIVAAVLQKLKDTNQQAWAGSGLSLVDALAAACAIPQLFPPTHIEGEQANKWIREKDLDPGSAEREFDLIDGAAIRRNPMPALFNWFQENRGVAHSLESASKQDARIHVIYGVPVEPFDANDGKPGPDRIDLVEAANVGMLMRVRRDTSIEVRQTNVLSEIVNAQKDVGATVDANRFAIFADEIAPARELDFKNPISPTRDEGLEAVAEGCRRTLGRLYAKELQEKARSYFVPCGDFLKEIAPSRSGAASIGGLPEVCAKCTGRLAPYLVPKRVPDMVKADFGKGPDLDLTNELPKLCLSDKPKIAFVASGGVFSGAFHIGLIGAMQALEITPDLVVGASVGTLMGGALAAIRNSAEKPQQLGLLARLTDTFLRVDETVALTVPLKTAVKQVGLRSRGLKLSPAGLRAAIRAGTANDTGYAATGVPPLVTDMLSQLFIIPPTETVKVGASFLAGRFANASDSLQSLVRENTLDSLGVRYAVIGTSLLEGVARTLLEAERRFDLNKRQPYLHKNGGTAIFCTTAYVNQRWLLVLGRDALVADARAFSFLHAALSSSAFPAAFPARQEREVFPGTGRVNNLFCDGGTFDNLPFMPTIELLSKTQEQRFKNSQRKNPELTELKFLNQRLQWPDLILSGGFDPAPANDRRRKFGSQGEVADRAGELGSSVKTNSFIAMSKRVARLLGQLSEGAAGKSLSAPVKEVMTRTIVVGVVNLAPSTELHVNPAFGFSRSLGLEPERVAASIANGCFQTMISLQQRRHSEKTEVGRSLRALEIDVELRTGAGTEGKCPYFERGTMADAVWYGHCPFSEAATGIKAKQEEAAPRADEAEANQGKEASQDAKRIDPRKKAEAVQLAQQAEGCRKIYESCGKDPVHRKLFKIEIQRKERMSKSGPGSLNSAE